MLARRHQQRRQVIIHPTAGARDPGIDGSITSC